MNKLGVDQKLALDALKRHGGYWPGGWILTNNSKTVRVLRSLVKHGLVEEIPAKKSYPWTGTWPHYKLIKEG